MDIWYGLDEVSPGSTGSVVTIGVFDGVHRGHRALITDAVTRARETGSAAVCLSFDPHPLSVIAPDRMPPLLAPVAERKHLVEQLGVDHMLALEFTRDLAAMSPAEFFSHILVDTLDARAVFVGANFTFGHRASGTTETLKDLGRAYGVDVVVHDLLTDTSGRTVSSSTIRTSLSRGDVADARRLLGRPFAVTGTVARGAGRGGRELGYPTANLYFPDSCAIPADGVYCGYFTITGNEAVDGDMQPGIRYPTAVSVGTNPTFNDVRRSVEAFVLDRDADLYGREVTVEFIDRIRGMEKFNGVDDLLAAMDRDVKKTRAILDNEAHSAG
ncbi:bifunctional riboflavin kinase/FAD synthetase [Corynebacterium mendelii]|uniref:Riboflavin biosynthesis protein n=1 Tax=Corynebacterium mendelii TaxID=2765362 RepID=A0A939E0K9_9CORY|nr:bifunctional riboflavin kinase/FAD synthetase [Corynebacterium mendelii]